MQKTASKPTTDCSKAKPRAHPRRIFAPVTGHFTITGPKSSQMFIEPRGDRVMEALQAWQQREKALAGFFGEGVRSQRGFMKEKLRFCQQVYGRHKFLGGSYIGGWRHGSPQEKATLAILKEEIEKLKDKLYPMLIERILVDLLDLFRFRPLKQLGALQAYPAQKKEASMSAQPSNEHGQEKTRKNAQQKSTAQKATAEEPVMPYLSDHQKINDMNEKNLEYLKDNIKRLGFGDKLHGDLEKNIREGKPEFTLNIANAVRADTLSSTLHFRKSDTTDMYFFNKYEAVLRQPGKEEKGQTFYIDKGKGVSAREAYNLLDGRSVYKDLTNKKGESYQAWVKLDLENKNERGNFKLQQFNNNYGYNLLEAVQNIKVPRTTTGKEEELAKFLEKGNISPLTIMGKNGEENIFIAANPQYKTLDMYDREMKPLSKEQKEALQHKPDSASHQKNPQPTEKINGESKSVDLKENTGLSKDSAGQKDNKEQKQDVKNNHSLEEKSSKKSNKNIARQPDEKSLMPKKRHGNKNGLSV